MGYHSSIAQANVPAVIPRTLFSSEHDTNEIMKEVISRSLGLGG